MKFNVSTVHLIEGDLKKWRLNPHGACSQNPLPFWDFKIKDEKFFLNKLS